MICCEKQLSVYKNVQLLFEFIIIHFFWNDRLVLYEKPYLLKRQISLAYCCIEEEDGVTCLPDII